MAVANLEASGTNRPRMGHSNGLTWTFGATSSIEYIFPVIVCSTQPASSYSRPHRGWTKRSLPQPAANETRWRKMRPSDRVFGQIWQEPMAKMVGRLFLLLASLASCDRQLRQLFLLSISLPHDWCGRVKMSKSSDIWAERDKYKCHTKQKLSCKISM